MRFNFYLLLKIADIHSDSACSSSISNNQVPILPSYQNIKQPENCVLVMKEPIQEKKSVLTVFETKTITEDFKNVQSNVQLPNEKFSEMSSYDKKDYFNRNLDFKNNIGNQQSDFGLCKNCFLNQNDKNIQRDCEKCREINKEEKGNQSQNNNFEQKDCEQCKKTDEDKNKTESSTKENFTTKTVTETEKLSSTEISTKKTTTTKTEDNTLTETTTKHKTKIKKITDQNTESKTSEKYQKEEDTCDESNSKTDDNVITVTRILSETKTVAEPITLYREITTTITFDHPIINYKVTTITEKSILTKTLESTETFTSYLVKTSIETQDKISTVSVTLSPSLKTTTIVSTVYDTETITDYSTILSTSLSTLVSTSFSTILESLMSTQFTTKISTVIETPSLYENKTLNNEISQSLVELPPAYKKNEFEDSKFNLFFPLLKKLFDQKESETCINSEMKKPLETITITEKEKNNLSSSIDRNICTVTEKEKSSYKNEETFTVTEKNNENEKEKETITISENEHKNLKTETVTETETITKYKRGKPKTITKSKTSIKKKTITVTETEKEKEKETEKESKESKTVYNTVYKINGKNGDCDYNKKRGNKTITITDCEMEKN